MAHLFVLCPGLSAVFSFYLFNFLILNTARKRVCSDTSSDLVDVQEPCSKRHGVKPEKVLEGLLKARLKIKHAYYKMNDNMVTSGQLWTLGKVLCGEQEDLIINL